MILCLVASAAQRPLAVPANAGSPDTLLRNGNQDFLVDPERPLLYFAAGDHVSFINTTTAQLTGDVVVGPGATSIDLSADRARLYIALSGDTKIAVVGVETRALERTIELGFAPSSVRHGRPDRLIVSDSTGLVHLVNETSGSTLASVPPYYGHSIVEASPNGSTFLVIDTDIDPVKVQRFDSTNDTPVFRAIDGHDLGSGFEMDVVDWSRGVIYLALGGPNGPGYGVEMVSVDTLARLGMLSTSPYLILTALAPDLGTVYGVTGGGLDGPVLWGFNATTRDLLGTIHVPSTPRYMGVSADKEAVVTAWPVERVSLRPSVVPRSPQPDAVIGYSPASVEAEVHRGIGVTGVLEPALSVNGIQLDAQLDTSDILRGDLRFELPDGRATVFASLSSGGDAVQAQWNFIVDSSLPIPGVSFTSFEHPSGFRIPVPRDWSLQTDQSVSGSTVELVLYGPRSATVQTTILVDTDRDPTVRENATYLGGVMDGILADIRSNDSGAKLFEGPVFRTLSNHSAITFAILYSDLLVQKATIVVSELHQRYWLILLTLSQDEYETVNPVYEHMLYGFEITAAPPGSSSFGGLAAALWLLVFLASGGISALVAFLAIRRPRGTLAPDAAKGFNVGLAPMSSGYCPRCGGPAGLADAFCSRCGSPLPSPPFRPPAA